MINLLPTSAKEELKKEENFRLILILGTTLLFFLISLILILFSIKIYLQGQLDFLKIQIEKQEEILRSSGFQELREKIIAGNSQISKLETFYKNQIDLVATLEKIFQKLPPQIYLTSLSWQREGEKVLLSGFSPTREVLFSFKNNLEKEPGFQEIYFPPQVWLKPVNISFEVIFTLKEK